MYIVYALTNQMYYYDLAFQGMKIFVFVEINFTLCIVFF